MAKKHTSNPSRALALRETFNFPRMSAPAPIVVRVPTALAAPKKSPKPHRRSSVGASTTSTLVGAIAGGAVLGYLDKNGTSIPTLPVVGRAGTLAIGCYLFRKHHGMLGQMANAFAAIAAYELMLNGTISGPGLAPQVGAYDAYGGVVATQY